MTLGLLVFVQLVIAAITTAPCFSENFSPLCSHGIPGSTTCTGASVSITATARSGDAGAAAPAIWAANASAYICFAAVSGMRSCGRLGPARLGTTVERSSSSVSEKTGSGVASVRKSPCALVYASTSFTWCSGRPERRRYLSVSSSHGKKPIVAPYSGLMFAIVARSASASDESPLP